MKQNLAVSSIMTNSVILANPVMRPIENDDISRTSLEGLIRDSYKKIFNAQLNSFLPNLVASTTIDDQIWAAFGYADAGQGKLFLENYLDDPIEELVSKKIGENIQRNKIVEVGNLFINHMADPIKTMRDVASYLQSLGYKWIVCTATRYLRLLFLKSGAEPVSIAQAPRSRVINDGSEWGTYYVTAPEILVGNINQNVTLIKQSLACKSVKSSQLSCINLPKVI